MCYRGSIMKGERAGKTKKVSISLDRSDLAVLERRAKEAHRGNLSAAVAEMAEILRQRAARERVIALLDLPPSTPDGLASVLAEQSGQAPHPAGRARVTRRRAG